MAKRKAPAQAEVLLVPANFDAASMLPPHLSRYEKNAYRLLHLIRQQVADGEADANGYARLKCEYLHAIIPDRVVTPLRAALVNLGIIDHDPKFRAGYKSQGYRLCAAYRQDTRTVQYEVGAESPARRGVATKSGKTRKRRSPKQDVHDYLDYWLTNLRIATNESRETVRRTPELAANVHDWFAIIDDIGLGLARAQSFVDRFGRFHHALTLPKGVRVPRALRRCLRVDRRPLVSVDVKSCAPLLVSVVVDMYLRGSTYVRRRMSDKDLFDRIRRNPYTALDIPNQRTHPAYTMRTRSEKPIQAPEDTTLTMLADTLRDSARDYVLICEDEHTDIYEFMTNRSSLTHFGREEFKAEFNAMLNGKRTAPAPRIRRVFEDEFEEIARVIASLTRHFYGQMGRLTMNIESTLIIDRACRWLMQEHPGVPLITIHDSIMTWPEHVDVVSAAIRRSFASVGVIARVKNN